MPTYDYICDACQHEWELFQKITEESVKKCPECNKKKAVRQFGTGAAIMFKGSGFYETDYRSEAYKKSAKADAKSSESGSSDSKSGDSKSGDGSSKSTSSKSDSSAKSNSQKNSSGKKPKK
jgi:putative FmdB family regulatory protein